jgi:asparagine synthase (glutamine-hydrolysing)
MLSRASMTGEVLEGHVRRMATRIEHRGPDDAGTWADAGAGVALGFRRLAILDLSAQGHQPMRSTSGRFTLVFNGEVYNFLEIRRELERAGAAFRGHSDTEVILAAFERWGIRRAVERFVGMFAIAVWDAEHHTLSLIRDRLGIKPLYVYQEPGLITFGSELKALLAGPSFDRGLDGAALTSYLRYLFVPAPRTIFARARKLMPGHIMTLRDAAAPLPASVPYWSVEEAARLGAESPFTGSAEEAVDELDRLLLEAVRLRMVADVPLGAFLSGGIDSSTVVALMQELSPRPVRTFSIGFGEEDYNEAHHARLVATSLGTDHTEVLLTARDALDVVPRLPMLFDEPFADPSQIPTLLVSMAARRDVTVALSGDGGDEVFAGYNRHIHGVELMNRVARYSVHTRRTAAAGLHGLSPASWDRAYRSVAPLLPPRMRQRLPGTKLHKMGQLLRAPTVEGMYRSLLSAWQQPETLVASSGAGECEVDRQFLSSAHLPLLHRMLLTDQTTTLVDDQLTKVDRASMAVSLEVRVPILDHRVVEFSWRLPPSLKTRDNIGKWALREVLYRRVPRSIVDRPKMGFSVPVDAWLRGELRPWAEELLSARRLRDDGVFAPEPIRRTWSEHLSGRGEHGLRLWTILMFQAWAEQWG